MTRGPRTRAVHGPDAAHDGAIVTPIHASSTFVLRDAAAVDDAYEGRSEAPVYSRQSNPTVASLERRLAHLEGTDDAVATGSGMAAITSTFLALVPSGGRIVATEDLYGTTASALAFLRDRLGVRVELVPTADADALRDALREPADLVHLETPTNPTLRLVDLRTAAEAARAAGVPTSVDSTFASPVNTRPHALGVDVVLHSATKYLAGHSDVLAGVACASAAHAARIRDVRRRFGGVLDPFAAFLVERGLKTLPLRVAAANENALRLAHALAAHERVARVHYPGLPTHPQHVLAKRQMAGFGGVVSFDLAGFEEATRFLDALRLVRNAASLGGAESLASIPVQQSHRHLDPAALARSGITRGTVRLALGIEDAADLVADVTQALDAKS